MNQPPHKANEPSPEEFELSQDQYLWNLLEEGSAREASPLFSRNVVREIRLENEKPAKKESFWQAFFRPQVLLAGGLAALLLIASILWNPSANQNSSNLADTTPSESIPLKVASSLESSLESELLLAAADSPELFSDEEVIAMLF